MPPFTNEEVCALEKFRKQVADVLPKDEFSQRDDSLIRWIRAREMNLDKAEQMLRHNMEWRKEHNIDRILDSGFDPELMEKFPFWLDGTDKFGRPVLTMPFGTWDIKGFIEADSDNLDRFGKHFNQIMEFCWCAIKRSTYEKKKSREGDHSGGYLDDDDDDNPCVQFLLISDLTGYSFGQLTNIKAVQAVLKLVSVFEAHYPETLGACFSVNAPTIYSILYGMMKPFMTHRTQEKVQIFNSNKENWLPAVLDVVDPSQLRERFGGTKS